MAREMATAAGNPSSERTCSALVRSEKATGFQVFRMARQKTAVSLEVPRAERVGHQQRRTDEPRRLTCSVRQGGSDWSSATPSRAIGSIPGVDALSLATPRDNGLRFRASEARRTILANATPVCHASMATREVGEACDGFGTRFWLDRLSVLAHRQMPPW